MPETSFTAMLALLSGPTGTACAIGFSAWAALCVGTIAFFQGASRSKTDDDRQAEDAEQMAWVKARADYMQALVRGDTRGQKAALETLMPRTNAVLARELGREWKA